MRHCFVERCPQRQQFRDPGSGISTAQQRARGIASGSEPEIERTGAQVNHPGPLLEQRAICLTQHDTAPGRQDLIPIRDQLRQQGALAIPKRRLALQFKDRGNRDAKTVFEHPIGIGKPPAQTSRKAPANGRLTGTHHPHENDRALTKQEGSADCLGTLHGVECLLKMPVFHSPSEPPCGAPRAYAAMAGVGSTARRYTEGRLLIRVSSA